MAVAEEKEEVSCDPQIETALRHYPSGPYYILGGHNSLNFHRTAKRKREAEEREGRARRTVVERRKLCGFDFSIPSTKILRVIHLFAIIKLSLSELPLSEY